MFRIKFQFLHSRSPNLLDEQRETAGAGNFSNAEENTHEQGKNYELPKNKSIQAVYMFVWVAGLLLIFT